MIRFGKYKGKKLSDIWGDDTQYVTWMANNIQDIDSRLDNEDKVFLKKVSQPYLYLDEKYNCDIFSKMTEEEIIDILKKEKYVKTARTYIIPSESGGVYLDLTTLYGSTYGSSMGFGNFDGEYNLVREIRKHLNKSKKWFNKYLTAQNNK